MERKIRDAILVPSILVFIINLATIQGVFDLIPGLSSLSLLLCLVPIVLEIVVLCYAGYSAVAIYGFNALGAVCVGAATALVSIGALELIQAVLILIGASAGSGETGLSVTLIVALILVMCYGISAHAVAGIIFGGLGGLMAEAAKPKEKPAAKKPSKHK